MELNGTVVCIDCVVFVVSLFVCLGHKFRFQLIIHSAGPLPNDCRNDPIYCSIKRHKKIYQTSIALTDQNTEQNNKVTWNEPIEFNATLYTKKQNYKSGFETKDYKITIKRQEEKNRKKKLEFSTEIDLSIFADIDNEIEVTRSFPLKSTSSSSNTSFSSFSSPCCISITFRSLYCGLTDERSLNSINPSSLSAAEHSQNEHSINRNSRLSQTIEEEEEENEQVEYDQQQRQNQTNRNNHHQQHNNDEEENEDDDDANYGKRQLFSFNDSYAKGIVRFFIRCLFVCLVFSLFVFS